MQRFDQTAYNKLQRMLMCNGIIVIIVFFFLTITKRDFKKKKKIDEKGACLDI